MSCFLRDLKKAGAKIASAINATSANVSAEELFDDEFTSQNTKFLTFEEMRDVAFVIWNRKNPSKLPKAIQKNLK